METEREGERVALGPPRLLRRAALRSTVRHRRQPRKAH